MILDITIADNEKNELLTYVLAFKIKVSHVYGGKQLTYSFQ